MTSRAIRNLRSLEGRQVGIALVDGSRIDDATLVSARATGVSLWLFSGGVDVFPPAADVVDVWEWRASEHRAS